MKMSNRISDNLKRFGAQKGYSLERVARLPELSLNTVVKIENGINKNPAIKTITKLEKALYVEIDDLIK